MAANTDANSNVIDFKLGVQFAEHQMDVRAVCSVHVNNNTLGEDIVAASGSRDTTVKIWSPITGVCHRTLVGHEHFVAALTPLPINDYFPVPSIASAGNDKIINVWDIEKGTSYYTLIGHEDVVCALTVTVDGLLVSSSWDKTVRVWKGPECIQVLRGHTHSVPAVLALDNGDIVTGSADHTIKIWRNGQCTQTIKKHTDVVRALAKLPGIGFVSAANDSVVCVWSNSGDCLQELRGHHNYIYTVAVNPTYNEIVTGGEDRMVKIWRNGECIQTIVHPGVVWAVSTLANGDIITGCSDHIARTWTRNLERMASADIQNAYQMAISQQSIPSSALGEMDINKLPGIEALSIPGTKDSQTKLVRNGQVVEAYQWSMEQQTWLKAGEVVDARSNQSKQVLEGKEYDYIFDVDIGDGQMRKLGYNNTENPYQTAQEFLWREELDQSLLDTVAQFIIKNAKPVVFGESSAPMAADPFTGKNAYVSGGSDEKTTQTQAPMGADPFTGKNAYVSGERQKQYVEAPMETETTTFKSPYKHFPLQIFLQFDTANYSAIQSKLQQFNTQLASDNNLKDHALSDSELSEINNVFKVLSETSRYHVSQFTPTVFKLLTTKLLQWPANVLFPVLDILRLSILHPDFTQKAKADLKGLSTRVIDLGIFSQPAVPANQMLALRFFVNMFRWESLHTAMLSQEEELLHRFASLIQTDNKNVKTALVSLVFNYSVLALQGKGSGDAKLQIISMLAEVFKNDKDEEVLYRGLVSLGNMVFTDGETMKLARDLDVFGSVKTLTSHPASKVQEVATELTSYASK